MKKRFSDEQIVGFLREAQSGGKSIDQLAREHGFSANSFYVWKRKFGAMAEPDVKRYRELEKENARLKRLLAERDVEIDVMKEVIEKAPDVSARRKLVPCFERRDVSVSRACGLLGVSRRRLKYVSRKNDADLVARLKMLAQTHPRFGIRQLCRQVRRQGLVVNLKRVRRLCRAHGLLLKQRHRRKRLGIGAGLACKAEYPNHVWSYDFVEDRTDTGRKLRILTIVDEFTRRCIELEVEHNMNAKFVARSLLRQFQVHGTPKFIRSDNGPEFIARFLMNVLKLHGVEARHIDPGSPWQNGIDERFNGTLRDECLNMETFHGRDHARAVIRLWRRFYNVDRPHGSLGVNVTPEEFHEQWKRGQARQSREKDGFAGGGGTGLSPCASSGRDGIAKGSGPTMPEHDRPDDRRMIHVGAPVAPQQSRILRVDEAIVTAKEPAGTFPARKTAPK